MANTIQNIADAAIPESSPGKREWNVNKIQAAACILISSGISIGLIAWAIYAFA